mmetsp:Transcript_10980/g.32944  ORF Transcript_10980/g.32944 Transcript_10980/m.32944 type:complete len:685 (-) Transcript_10980:2402-4456(-)
MARLCLLLLAALNAAEAQVPSSLSFYDTANGNFVLSLPLVSGSRGDGVVDVPIDLSVVPRLSAVVDFPGSTANVGYVDFRVISGGAIACPTDSCVGHWLWAADYCFRELAAPYALYGKSAGVLSAPPPACELPTAPVLTFRAVVDRGQGASPRFPVYSVKLQWVSSGPGGSVPATVTFYNAATSQPFTSVPLVAGSNGNGVQNVPVDASVLPSLTAIADFPGGVSNVKAVYFRVVFSGSFTNCNSNCAGPESGGADYCRREGVAPHVLYGDGGITNLITPPTNCVLPAATVVTLRVVVEEQPGNIFATYSVRFELTGCFLTPPPTAFSTNPQNGVWRMLAEELEAGAPPPDIRHESTFALANGKMYLLGGRNIGAGNGDPRQVDIWDPVKGLWVPNPTNAQTDQQHHFQAVIVGDDIWLATAMTGGFPNEPPLPNVMIYDTNTDEYFESEISIPIPRGAAGSVYYQGKVYVASGIFDGHWDDTTDSFMSFDVDGYFALTDPPGAARVAAIAALWDTTLPPVPNKRDHTQAVVLFDKLYLMGGRISNFGVDGNVFNDTITAVDVYDFGLERWLTPAEAPPDVPKGGAAPGVVVWRGTIIYIGGEAPEGAHDNVYQYDPATNLWTELATMPYGRHGFGVVNYNDYLFIGGGSRTRGGGNTADLLVWPQLSTTPSPTGGDCSAPDLI